MLAKSLLQSDHDSFANSLSEYIKDSIIMIIITTIILPTLK